MSARAFASDDAALMKRIQSGDAGAFRVLAARYGDRAYRVARSVCNDHGCAEDGVQEAFTAIWRRRADYTPGRGAVAAWLMAVVRYRTIDVVRANAGHARHCAEDGLADAQPAGGVAVPETVLAHEDASRLHDLLKQLPDAQREVIVLAFYGELTHAEIARELDLPPGTVKGRMRLGLRKLRADMEPVAHRRF